MPIASTIDPQLIAQHLPRFLSANGNGGFDAPSACRVLEQELRRYRFLQEMTAAAPEPTSEEIDTKVYHKDGQFYGTTKHGKFMTEDEAKQAGLKAAKEPTAKKTKAPAKS